MKDIRVVPYYGESVPLEFDNKVFEFSMISLMTIMGTLIENGYNVMILAHSKNGPRDTVAVLITKMPGFHQR